MTTTANATVKIKHFRNEYFGARIIFYFNRRLIVSSFFLLIITSTNKFGRICNNSWSFVACCSAVAPQIAYSRCASEISILSKLHCHKNCCRGSEYQFNYIHLFVIRSTFFVSTSIWKFLCKWHEKQIKWEKINSADGIN